MKKKLSLFLVTFLAVFAIAFAKTLEDKSVTYALTEGDTFTSGQTVEVKNGTDVVATITYGEDGGEAFKAAKADKNIEGFTAFTEGNGTNGNKTGGTFYTITPKFDGTIEVAVALNADKAFYIEEDGTALADYNGIKVTEKYYGIYKFTAKADKSYKIYCAGSKLGFYGFKYNYAVDDDDPTPVETKTIYMRPGVWASADAVTRYAVYAFNESDNAWFDLAEVKDDEGTFSADIPENYTGIILVRMDGTKEENTWNNAWNQTADIDFTQTADNTLFTIDATNWGDKYTPYATSEYTGPEAPAQKYNVLVDDGMVFGTVEADKYEAAEGDQVALKVLVKEEYQDTYELDALTVTGVDGAPIDTHEIVGSEYNYAFTMPAQEVTVSATFKEIAQPVEINSMGIRGTFPGLSWDEDLQMRPADDGNKTWIAKMENVTVGAETYYYKATANGNWNDYVLPEKENAEFEFGTNEYPAGTYNLTFTANVEENTIELVAEKVEEPQPVESVVLDFTAQGYENGQEVTSLTVDPVTVTLDKGTNSNSPKYYSTGDAVRLYGGGTMTVSSKTNISNITITFGTSDGTNEITASPGTYKDGVWTGDAKEVVFTIGGTTGNRRFQKLEVTLGEGGGDQPADPVYIAAGDKAVWGSSWDAKDTNNQLTKNNDGKFSITKEDLNLAAGEYGYKIVKDGAWIPDGEGNERKLSIAENGKYAVTLTVDPEAEADYLATATKTGEYVEPEPVYVAVGVKELWGVDAWTIAEENTLIKGNDGKYSITKENLLLPEGQYGYKIVKDGNTWIPDGTDNEKKLEITETAYYNVTLTVDPADVENYLATAEKAAPINTIAEVQAAEAKTEVTVQGIIYASAAKGAVLYDGDDYLYYYNTKNALNIGQKVLMAGKVGKYGGASQLTADATITDLGTVDGVVYPDPVELKAADFDAIAKENTETVKRQYVTYTGKLTISNNYYNIAIEGTEANIMAALVAPKEDISDLNGKDVVVKGYMMYKTTSNNTIYAYTVATSVEEYVEIPTYTATFTTNLGWENVYAYAWAVNEEKQDIIITKTWPGDELEATEGVYTFSINSAIAPQFIIFNDGTNDGSEAVGVNKTGNLPFVDGMIYSLTTEKTTAWAGDPDEEIPATTGIEISATTCKDAGVQAEKIIRIVAKEIAVAAPARAFDNAATALGAGDISVLKGKVDEPLVADELLNYSEGVYEFTATAEIAAEMKENGFRIKPKNDKQIAITSIEVKKAPEPTTFAEKVAAALEAGTGEVTVTMEQDETLDAAINVPLGKQLVLDGANKTLTLGEATNFVLNDGFTLKNVNIDASALGQPLVQMNATPAMEPVESGQYIIKNAITFDNVKATGLTKNLFSDAGKSYAYEHLNINNSVFEYATQTGVVMNLAASMAINFNITNSTFYSKEAGSANFIAMSGKRPWQITGYEEETGKLTVANNTFYNVAKSKQFMNTNTLKGQKYLYVFNSNIFVDVSNKKIYGNMTNNKNQLTTDGQNTYLFDGAFFAETNYNGDEGLQSDPSFKDAANGDFTIGASTAQAKNQTGDPRWLVQYFGYYLAGNMNDWKPVAEYELKANTAAEGVEEYMITVDLAADAQFKIAKSNGTTIDDANWYPSGMGNNYGENGELQGAGKYTVYFRPNADGGDDWFYHVIYAQKFYNITVVNCEGMTITPEVTEAAAGTKVWATVAMTEGYEPEFPGFTNTDTGDVIDMTEGTDVGMDEETGKVWIIMPAQNLTITAKAAKVSLITLDLSQENGSATCISVNKEDPASFYKKEGKEIYLTVTPNAGYTADITVTAGEDPVEVIAEAGTYHDQPYTHKFIMPAKDVTVKVTFTKSTGINGIDADDADDNAPIYNLAGQKVDKNYKGVVIKNGKKVYQK